MMTISIMLMDRHDETVQMIRVTHRKRSGVKTLLVSRHIPKKYTFSIDVDCSISPVEAEFSGAST